MPSAEAYIDVASGVTTTEAMEILDELEKCSSKSHILLCYKNHYVSRCRRVATGPVEISQPISVRDLSAPPLHKLQPCEETR